MKEPFRLSGAAPEGDVDPRSIQTNLSRGTPLLAPSAGVKQLVAQLTTRLPSLSIGACAQQYLKAMNAPTPTAEEFARLEAEARQRCENDLLVSQRGRLARDNEERKRRREFEDATLFLAEEARRTRGTELETAQAHSPDTSAGNSEKRRRSPAKANVIRAIESAIGRLDKGGCDFGAVSRQILAQFLHQNLGDLVLNITDATIRDTYLKVRRLEPSGIETKKQTAGFNREAWEALAKAWEKGKEKASQPGEPKGAHLRDVSQN
ncbi:hypothetical protein [Azoarcus sp. DN11]|uniref:hypothetical protein n=1 Tax=Azoarcus sp. DN11 TaxID=356837 RepID=UPI000EB2FF24|nr:hypothetical protein [Azoarcus sp. DN11]AYH43344.1 hypothetical protein CDA09_08110 [Azoarcus sp. DN11]